MPIHKNTESQLDEKDIHRSKCLLNAAIPASLKGKHVDDIRTVKDLVFDILDSEDIVYDGIKEVLIEGDLFDAAQMLEYKARRMPDRAAVLFSQAAVLFAPLMNLKSLIAFEQAQKHDAELGPYHAMMARLHDRMGDPKASQLQRKLADKYNAKHPQPMADRLEAEPSLNLPDNVTYLSFRK